MRLPFNSPDLSAVPADLRDMAPALLKKAESSDEKIGDSPNWQKARPSPSGDMWRAEMCWEFLGAITPKLLPKQKTRGQPTS